MERSDNTSQNSESHDQQMVSDEQSKVVSRFDKFKDNTPLIESVEKDGITEVLEDKPTNKKPLFKRPWFLILISILLVLILLLSWMGFVGYQTFQKVQGVETHAKGMMAALDARDLGKAKEELASVHSSLNEAKSSYSRLQPLSYIPFLGNYIKDGSHAFQAGVYGADTGDLVLEAIKPYADVLGFAGADSKLEFNSAEDRIIFLATTVEKLAPQMDEIGKKLGDVSSELQYINAKRYPKTVKGVELRSKIEELQNTVKSTSTSLADFQPFIKLLPDLLGNPDKRRYFLLFQNNAELRPTGGFMTAYATMNVLKGKIEPGISEDIYSLDNAFKKKVAAPDPIRKYLPLVYNWYIRDMNLSPDFKNSMDTFTDAYRTIPNAPEVDAIVAIDTEVPVRLLKILGPIGVGGYGGQFSAENDPRCNCPQIIYELENIITKPTYEIREGRKSILGPLMNSMLANMMGSPKSKWPEFFTVFTDAIRQKHLMMYFFDKDKQAAIEALGAGGRIVEYPGDYLHINDANFAGAKSNLFVEQEVEQTITLNPDGSATKKLVLTYKNPRQGDNCNLEAGKLCLNGLLRDWIRIYVPKGSVLKSGKGFEVDMTTSEDLGKTTFEAFFTLAPQSVKKLEVEYTIPAGTVKGLTAQAGDYKMLVQNQPGTKAVKHTITLNGGKQQIFTVDSDKEIILSK